MKLTKEDIIGHAAQLYEQMRDDLYSSWYNRSTMTAWEESWEYTRYVELDNAQVKFEADIEETFNEKD